MSATRLDGALAHFLLPCASARDDDEGVLLTVDFFIGIALMVLGMACVVWAMFRALGRVWSLGLYELWILPAAGVGLILLGRWLIQ
jgi:hypothetical protein